MFSWFERRQDPFAPHPFATPPKTILEFCLYFSKNFTMWQVGSAILSSISGMREVLIFGFIGKLVDRLAHAQPDQFFADEHVTLLLLTLVVAVVFPAVTFLQALISGQVLGLNFGFQVQWMIHRIMLRKSYGYYTNDYAGRISNRVFQASGTVRSITNAVLGMFFHLFGFLLSAGFMLMSADLWLLLPLGLWLSIQCFLGYFYLSRLRGQYKDIAEARSTMIGRVVDAYTNFVTVKLFSHSTQEEHYLETEMSALRDKLRTQFRLLTPLRGLMALNNNFSLCMSCGLALYLWSTGHISVGVIAISLGLVMRLNSLAEWVLWRINGFLEDIGTIRDSMSLFEDEYRVDDSEDAVPLVMSSGAIRFDAVRFHYGKAKGVIEDLSLAIAPGEKIGLVGRSGAGKTTLMNLLLRFYDVEAGAIYLDGKNVKQVTQDSLRANIGVVTQDPSLLHRSIRENIAYGRPCVHDEAVILAAKRANAWDFIEGLEDQNGRKGLDAHVGERGVKLSGGQRQRIAIARVFLKDAPILVLDEATSALDSEAEAAIQENLFDLMKGKTVIAIAHRLSTLTEMDRLVVLDKGRIVQTGSHQELISQGGLYADLWSRQSGGFIDAAQDSGAKPI